MDDKKAFLVQYGFEVTCYPTIMNGRVFRWNRGSMEISASRDGVAMVVCGFVDDVASVMRALESAMYVRDELKKNDDPDHLYFDGKMYSSEAWKAGV